MLIKNADGFGEVLSNPENRMYIDTNRKDKWDVTLNHLS